MQSKTITINGDIIIEIVRVGQMPVQISDNVEVCAKLKIRANEKSGYKVMKDEYIFGYRLRVCGENMLGGWGYTLNSEDDFRSMVKNFDAKTWREAENLAEDYMREEVKKLTDAIAKRKQALIDADAQ